MSRTAKVCFLQCVKSPSKTINLPHGKTIYLGRNQQTMVTDTFISRKQVSATANYDSYLVAIQTIGVNYSGCNGCALQKNSSYHLKHGDLLELRLGCHGYNVVFQPPPHCNDNGSEEPDKKRTKLNFPIFTVSNTNIKDDNLLPSAVNSNINLDPPGIWESIDNGELLIYTFLNPKSQTKVAGFDLDSTIIKTKSGSRFAKNWQDWVLNYLEIPQKLKELVEKGYKIVIFTNQGGVKQDPIKVNEFKSKIEAVFAHINIPLQLFAATTKSIYRKPAPGMWKALHNEKNDGMNIDILNSFYVGDAAGREKNWAPKKNKDHSVGDRLFAINMGLKFYTPEEYFLGARSVQYTMPKFDPRNIKSDHNHPSTRNICEVIMMVGSPASGKSFYCKEHLVKNGYAYVNRDTLGSWQACVKALEKSVQDKQSVVIDNTNADKATRKRYVDAAKRLNVPCRCFLMTTSPQHSKHNNRFRELTDKNHGQVGEVILNMYKKHFEEPTVSEGFEEVVKVDFMPKFDDIEQEMLYKMFLIES